MSISTFEEQFSVASYHCDATRRLRPDGFLHYCQEAAENHAHQESFGYTWGMQQGLIWVMTQADVLIHRRPEWKEQVILRTSTGTMGALQASRWVHLYAADGQELLIEAELRWLLIDIVRRRPCPFKKAGIAISPIESTFPATVADGEWSESSYPVTEYETGWRDLDFHGHVNNAAYLTWILNALPQRVSHLKQIRISFLKESAAGEKFLIQHDSLEDGLWTRHHIKDEAGTVRAQVTCRWDDSECI